MNEQQKKLLEQIDRLIQKAEQVKTTHRPNPSNVIGFPTLSEAAFSEWKNGVESLIVRVAGKESTYYGNFQKGVKFGYKNHVDVGVGLLHSLREDVRDGNLSENKTLGIPPEQIGIQHVKNPHTQYWRKVIVDTGAWFRDHIFGTVFGGLILAGLLYLLGLN